MSSPTTANQKILTFINKLSGKHFIYVDYPGQEKLKLITPEGKIKTLESDLFDKTESYLSINDLLLQGYINDEQVKTYNDLKKQTTELISERKEANAFSDYPTFLIDKKGIKIRETSGTGMVVNILKESAKPISISEITRKIENKSSADKPKVKNILKRVERVISWLSTERLISIVDDKIILLKINPNAIDSQPSPKYTTSKDNVYDNNSNLSLIAKKIFNNLPHNGSKIGNIILRHKLKLSQESYVEGKKKLIKTGLIVIGKGRGGSIGRAKIVKDIESFDKLPQNHLKKHNMEFEMNPNLSLNAKNILKALPSDGAKIGNITLRNKLKLSNELYRAGKEELKKAGLIVAGQGRGGSVGRAKREENVNSFLEKRDQLLYDLVDPQKKLGENQLGTSSEEWSEVEHDTEELSFDDQDTDDDIDDISSQERQIFSDKSDPSILDLYGRFKDGELVLQPDFQRQFIWDYKKCSRLIESAILEVPLPMIYLAEEKDGREAVIDGQQRLTAFFKFLDSDYPLTGINVLKEQRGNYFVDLDRSIQNAIKRCSIRTTTIKKESSESLRFEIFERLNTGAVSLNDQELRNCIYRGPYNLFLKELSQDPDFKYLIGITKLEKRMRDVELVLRFAAFYHTSYLNYSSPMRKFLNADMMRYQYISEDEQDELRKAFKNSLHIIRSLFDKHAFRRFYRGTNENVNGYWEPKKFSASLYDVLMYTFSTANKHQVYQQLDAIRESIIHCMTEDDDFIETIERGTSNKVMIVRRFDKLRLKLEDILAYDFNEPRCFSLNLKTKLFDNNQTCAICSQRIHSIDDAAVDHIKQYWRGGRTMPENARLTHRFCNWSRSRKE
jgi:hypothetical protein